jgi:hypothetical protein
MPEFKVEDVKLGALDSAGAEIDTVYYKWDGDHAIFRTTERVVIQYADAKDMAGPQRTKLASLNVIRGEINGLIDGWRKGNPLQKSKAKLFDRRVADALEYAFESDNSAAALATLSTIKADVLAERTAVARSEYIIAAGIAVLILAAIACYLASPLSWIDPFFKPFWAAAGFGGMGALFSIAIGIHTRSMGTDLQRRQNTVDATLRILIGALSAFILYLLLRADIVSLKIGNADLKNIYMPAGLAPACSASGKPAACPVTLLFAGMALTFLAGFAERWVGDMLNRLVDTVSANPLAGRPRNTPTPDQSLGKNGNKDPSRATDDKAASPAKDDKAASPAKDDKAASPAKDDKAASPAQDDKGDSQAASAAPESPANADQPASGAGAVATEAKIEGDPSALADGHPAEDKGPEG